jgi:hypothetical protein
MGSVILHRGVGVDSGGGNSSYCDDAYAHDMKPIYTYAIMSFFFRFIGNNYGFRYLCNEGIRIIILFLKHFIILINNGNG